MPCIRGCRAHSCVHRGSSASSLATIEITAIYKSIKWTCCINTGIANIPNDNDNNDHNANIHNDNNANISNDNNANIPNDNNANIANDNNNDDIDYQSKHRTSTTVS